MRFSQKSYPFIHVLWMWYNIRHVIICQVINKVFSNPNTKIPSQKCFNYCISITLDQVLKFIARQCLGESVRDYFKSDFIHICNIAVFNVVNEDLKLDINMRSASADYSVLSEQNTTMIVTINTILNVFMGIPFDLLTFLSYNAFATAKA